jgi:hypothetical protein
MNILAHVWFTQSHGGDPEYGALCAGWRTAAQSICIVGLCSFRNDDFGIGMRRKAYPFRTL